MVSGPIGPTNRPALISLSWYAIQTLLVTRQSPPPPPSVRGIYYYFGEEWEVGEHYKGMNHASQLARTPRCRQLIDSTHISVRRMEIAYECNNNIIIRAWPSSTQHKMVLSPLARPPVFDSLDSAGDERRASINAPVESAYLDGADCLQLDVVRNKYVHVCWIGRPRMGRCPLTTDERMEQKKKET